MIERIRRYWRQMACLLLAGGLLLCLWFGPGGGLGLCRFLPGWR